MSIVKIWGIKAEYAGDKSKVGGLDGVKNAEDYIKDEEKVIQSVSEENSYKGFEPDDISNGTIGNNEGDVHRVVEYMANEDKTKSKYISTYLCDSNNVTQEFRTAANLLQLKTLNKCDPDSGNLAFHLVQSFPEDLEISDEEVHQCGVELVEKLRLYQALICSHVHPVKDSDGNWHGKSKHNHILLNAFIHPKFVDQMQGGPYKYHDCTETYRQLQIYNDEISLEHGLPIIREPDMERTYSWFETEQINAGTSWKERVRLDIETYRRVARDFDDFLVIMKKEGYNVTVKKHITYTTPDGKVVRGSTLGQQYTKETLELYWAIRDNAKRIIKEDLKLDNEPILSDFAYNYHGELRVKIPLGPQFTEGRQFGYFPLSKENKASEDSLRTYMAMDQLYDICDENGQVVASASGIEILRSIEDLKDEGRMKYRERMRMDAEAVREDRRQKNEEKAQKDTRGNYSNNKFKNSRTGALYQSSLYDQDGRRRSMLELIFVLALVILEKESILWIPRGEVTEEQKNEPFFARTDWKMQNIVDAIELSRKEELETPAQLDKRLNAVGAEYSRTKKAYNNTSRAAAKMETLADAIAKYKRTSKLAESILAMPPGPEKDAMLKQHDILIEEYKAAKHVMYVNGVRNEAGITDFDSRYKKITEDVEVLGTRLKESAEHYRRLKKLQYSLQLAQDPRFIYGPSYPGADYQFKELPEKEEPMPLWHKLDESQAKAQEHADEAKSTETNAPEKADAKQSQDKH